MFYKEVNYGCNFDIFFSRQLVAFTDFQWCIITIETYPVYSLADPGTPPPFFLYGVLLVETHAR